MSPDRSKIVRIGVQRRKVVRQTRIGLNPRKPRHELRFGHPRRPLSRQWREPRHCFAVHCDLDGLATGYATKHTGGVVPQLTRGHPSHAYARSTSVAGPPGCLLRTRNSCGPNIDGYW